MCVYILYVIFVCVCLCGVKRDTNKIQLIVFIHKCTHYID